jgi:hypothetical protein
VPPARRPTARRLATAIAAAVPAVADTEPRAPQGVPSSTAAVDPIERLRPATGPMPRRSRARARRAAAAVAAAGVVAVAAGLVGREPHDASAPTPGGVAGDEVREPAPTLAAAPVPRGGLLVGDQRYRIGQPGDEVVLGDWDCDGTATPALLRPTTGEVFVFPRWATTGTLSVAPSARVPGAEALVGRWPRGRCPQLAVRTTTGSHVAVLGRPR